MSLSIQVQPIGLYNSLWSCVLVLGSKEAEEVEAEQNLEIAFRLLIVTQGWGEVVQGVTQVGVAH